MTPSIEYQKQCGSEMKFPEYVALFRHVQDQKPGQSTGLTGVNGEGKVLVNNPDCPIVKQALSDYKLVLC